MNLQGKVALVTGGAKGIGKAIVIALAEDGADVVVNYQRSRRESDYLARELGRLSRKILPLKADVTIPKEAARMFNQAEKRFRKIDILVNNVGNFMVKPLAELTFPEWDEVIKSNLYSTFICSRLALPGMRIRKWGRIINISAAYADRQGAFVRTGAYAAAKQAILTLTRTLALEEAKNRITVNAVGPGITDTGYTERMRHELIKLCPMGRFAKPEEIARVAVFLCQNESEYITGAHVPVGGGWGL
jgi:acetoacetyl-CoA reductase